MATAAADQDVPRDALGEARRVLQGVPLSTRLQDADLHDIATDASSSGERSGAGHDSGGADAGTNGRHDDVGFGARHSSRQEAMDALLRSRTPGTASLEGSASLTSVGFGDGDAGQSAVGQFHQRAKPRSALKQPHHQPWASPVDRGHGGGASTSTPSSAASRRTPADSEIEKLGRSDWVGGTTDAAHVATAAQMSTM